MTWGIGILVFFGGFFWLVNLGILSWHRDWPLILIFLGGYPILYYSLRKSRRRGVIRDLERGKITPEQAEERLKKSR